jgi:hypothetical protein
MGWMKLSVAIPLRRAVFTFTSEEFWKSPIAGPSNSDLRCRGLASDKPEEMEPLFRALVEHHRPRLKGCCVEWIDYKYDTQTYEVAVSHGDLPQVNPGERCERARLILDDSKYETVRLMMNEPGETVELTTAYVPQHSESEAEFFKRSILAE